MQNVQMAATPLPVPASRFEPKTCSPLITVHRFYNFIIKRYEQRQVNTVTLVNRLLWHNTQTLSHI